MDFEKICMMFTMQEPFYGILLSSMDKNPVSEQICPTLGVCRSGNVFRLMYNPAFINNQSVDSVLELLKHETLHLALDHFFVLQDKRTDGNDDLINIAADCEANSYINKSKLDKDILAGGAFAEKFGLPEKLGAREYYDLLVQQAQSQKQQAQQSQQSCNGGQGGQPGQSGQSGRGQNQQQNQAQNNQQQSSSNQSQSGNNSGGGNNSGQNQESQSQNNNRTGLDDHSKWPTEDDGESAESIQQAINSLIEFAADEVEKNCGSIPSEVVGRVEAIRKRPKPVADWRRYFRRFLGHEFSDQIKKSRKRESARFPDAAGNRHKRKSHILVAIDTSGSVSMPEYKEFFGQILTLRDRATFRVLECDAKIQHEYEFTGKIHETLHGGGGTDFEPVTTYYQERRKLFDALVFFTDGGASIPNNTPKETLWVISSRGNHERSRYLKNGASAVFIKPTK